VEIRSAISRTEKLTYAITMVTTGWRENQHTGNKKDSELE
jgi:hypothetical protein